MYVITYAQKTSSTMQLLRTFYLPLSQEKQPTIAGSIAMENNIRHYIKAMVPWISTITQLSRGYPPVNVVGHFMTHLNTKSLPPLYVIV